MKRSRASKKQIAEKALREAISEETGELRGIVRQKDSEIARLHGVIAQIGSIVSSVPKDGPAVKHLEPAKLAAAAASVMTEPAIPSGPSVPLDEEDTLGEGRWA